MLHPAADDFESVFIKEAAAPRHQRLDMLPRQLCDDNFNFAGRGNSGENRIEAQRPTGMFELLTRDPVVGVRRPFEHADALDRRQHFLQQRKQISRLPPGQPKNTP